MLEEVRVINHVGWVSRVMGLVVESVGPESKVGELCRIMNGEPGGILAEVIGFDEDRVLMMPYMEVSKIRKGSEVIGLGKGFRVYVGEELLGRVLNGLGEGMDGKEDIIDSRDQYELYHEGPCPLDRVKVEEVLETGVSCIDGMLTVGKGQRMGIFAGTGVGKSSLLGMIARNSRADVNVIGLIGERGREVRDFIEKDLGEEGLKKSVLVVSTGDNAAIMRVRAGFVATAIAEYFRDCGKDVVLMVDSLTRLARAQREVGLSLGEVGTTRGYPASVYSLLGKLIERVGGMRVGSITGFYTVLVEGDDFNEPISDNVRGFLDGHIHLSRRLSNEGYYPAVDLLNSMSRLAIDLVSKRCMEKMRSVRELLALYKEYEDLILIGAYARGGNAKVDKAIQMYGVIKELFRQDLDEVGGMEETFGKLFELFGDRFEGLVDSLKG